jgi:hypothetical protein
LVPYQTEIAHAALSHGHPGQAADRAAFDSGSPAGHRQRLYGQRDLSTLKGGLRGGPQANNPHKFWSHIISRF